MAARPEAFDDCSIHVGDLSPVGHGLVRPECVLVMENGRLACSDARGGITYINPDGTQKLMVGREKLVPNGIAALRDGGFLLANVGEEGGLWHLTAEGQLERLDIQVSGKPLPEVNFVHVDHMGRIWLAISSFGSPDPVFTLSANEGRILLGDCNGFRVVAEGLGWTNELRVHPDGERLFVNETFGRRLVEYRIGAAGALQDRNVLVDFGHGDYPDGMALDEDGGIWVVSIISNRIYRYHGTNCQLMFSDGNQEIIDRLERRLLTRGLRRADLHNLQTGLIVNNISSIAFGGLDRRTAWLGSLNSENLWSFRSPAAGLIFPPGSPVFPMPSR